MVNRDGMTSEEALEYYEFNILSCYLGENSPIVLESIEDYSWFLQITRIKNGAIWGFTSMNKWLKYYFNRVIVMI